MFFFKLDTATYLHTYLICYISLISITPLIHPLGPTIQRVILKTKFNIGKRTFSIAAPTIRNQLPIAIKASNTLRDYDIT